MALQSSPSSSSDRFEYDVFLSFRGFDTRVGFTGYLYKALCDRGIRTFIDDRELKGGEEITPSLLKAIEDSMIAIIVFSKNYAHSSFCLDELVHIIECSKAKNLLVLPVFYGVEPTHLRHQTGDYGEAIAKHEVKFKDNKETYIHNMERLQKWKICLKQTADLSGHAFNFDREEYQLIQEIVKQVSKTLDRTPLLNIDYVVGMESRIQDVLSLLKLESNSDGALMMGIYGPGGIGKTTLARVTYNMIAERFEALCFLPDVRKNSSIHGLVHLQNMVLSEVIGEKDSNLTNVDIGALRIKNRLKLKKVLLILDDVDTLEQLEALAGKPDWFGPGSRVIVTTRDKHLLAFHEVERTYEVQPLSPIDALELLSQKVFKQGDVDSSYIGILNEFVSYASGLPLALEVIGSHLFGKSVQEWTSVLHRFKRNPYPSEIQKKLKISFDSLREEEKSLFLDIACCFQGYDFSEALDILHAHHANDVKLHIDVLIDKSLISSSDGKMTLHPLIEDMGKEIVRQENPKEPGKRSRLWLFEDIIQVLKNNTGTNSIEIIHLDSPLVEDDESIEWDGEAFKKMENLKTLIIRKCKFSQAPEYLPKSLRVLEWWTYPLEELPSDFNPNQLVISKLPHMRITSPEASQSGPHFLPVSVIAPVVSNISQSEGEVPQTSPTTLEGSPTSSRVLTSWEILASTSVLGVSQIFSSVLKSWKILQRVYGNINTWRIVGLVSAAVGLSSFALSPSFNRLIRGWKSWKFFIYGVLSLVVLTALLFVRHSSLPAQLLQQKIMGFVVLMLLSVYTFYYDKAVNGKPEILSLVANAAFALLSISFSKLMIYGSEKGLFTFFLTCLAVQLWTINWKLIFVAIVLGCAFFYMHSSPNPKHSSSDSKQEQLSEDTDMVGSVAIQISSLMAIR